VPVTTIRSITFDAIFVALDSFAPTEFTSRLTAAMPDLVKVTKLAIQILVDNSTEWYVIYIARLT
jgi:hypothetical protein